MRENKESGQSLVEQIREELREKLVQTQVVNMVNTEKNNKSGMEDLDMEDLKMVHDDLVKLEEIGVTLEELGFNSEDARALQLILKLWENRRH